MLSDEQIAEISQKVSCSDDECGHIDEIEYARAIERAARAEAFEEAAKLFGKNCTYSGSVVSEEIRALINKEQAQ